MWDCCGYTGEVPAAVGVHSCPRCSTEVRVRPAQAIDPGSVHLLVERLDDEGWEERAPSAAAREMGEGACWYCGGGDLSVEGYAFMVGRGRAVQILQEQLDLIVCNRCGWGYDASTEGVVE